MTIRQALIHYFTDLGIDPNTVVVDGKRFKKCFSFLLSDDTQGTDELKAYTDLHCSTPLFVFEMYVGQELTIIEVDIKGQPSIAKEDILTYSTPYRATV